MAVITKFRFREGRSATNMIRYVFKKQLPGDPSDGEKVFPDADSVMQSFKAVRDLHNCEKGENEILTFEQSFPHDESAKLSREEVNKMGRQLVEKYFEGHQFIVVTHSNEKHLHNHIIVNCVAMESGKRIPNKFVHRKKLIEINDQICKERGLSVPKVGESDRLPENVQRMRRFRGQSYILATIEKAEFARKYSTSFDEYRGILGNLGIGVQIDPKNITYFYQGFERGVRGKKLGKPFDKPGLQEKFAENDALFQKHPELRDGIAAKIDAARLLNGDSLKIKKDYSAYTKMKRGDHFVGYPSDVEFKNSIVPMDEIRRAREGSIFEYCKRKKIGLATNEKGETVLKGKSFVVLSDKEWVNRKNNTRGSLIEFVAAHNRCSFLQAISKINENPRLLLLEKHFDAERAGVGWQSFYIPKQMEPQKARNKVMSLLSFHGASPNSASILLSSGRVQVSQEGLVRFLPKGEPTGALEFAEEKDGTWTRKSKGKIKRPFHEEKGMGYRTVVFTDPISFIKAQGSELFAGKKRNEGVLVLMEPDPDQIEKHIAQNANLKGITIFAAEKPKLPPVELDFFNNLKKRVVDFGIDIDSTSDARSLKRGGHKISR